MAEIKINQAQWEAIDNVQQQAIVAGLREIGALQAEDTIVADADTAAVTDESGMAPLGLFSGVCKIACDVAAAAAGTWCTANTAGLGLTVCLAAAAVIRNECRSRC
jgi:hypothetical protein